MIDFDTRILAEREPTDEEKPVADEFIWHTAAAMREARRGMQPTPEERRPLMEVTTIRCVDIFCKR